MGVEMRPMRWAYAIIPTWPLFVFLVRWRAGVESQQLDFEQLGEAFIALDERAEASFSKPLLSDDIHEGIAAGFRSGMQQGGGGSLFFGMILAAITLGGWLVWELVRGGPRLLADTMIDAELVRSHPQLFEKVITYPWMAELFGATAIQFVGLTIAAFLLGLSWPLDFF